MKNFKKYQITSMIMSSLLLSQSFALADSAKNTLIKGIDPAAQAAILSIVKESTQMTTQDLVATRNQILNIINSLNTIQNDNEKDQFLKYANSIQTGLALATTLTLGSQISSLEKRKFMLTISAATAVISSVIRVYKQRSTLDNKDVSAVLNDFTTDLMKSGQAFSPEMRELVTEVSKVSTTVLSSKTMIESLVGNATDGSYLTTLMIVGMAVAHWVSPKLAGEAETALQKVKVAVGSALSSTAQVTRKFADESKVVVGTASGGSVLPDVIGNIMGLNSEGSRVLINQTVNSLITAAVHFQAQIDKTKVGESKK